MQYKDENVPEGCEIFPHQVAGHRYHGEKIRGMLLDNDGKLLKCIQMPPRGTREVDLYQCVFGIDVSDSVTLKLRSFLPAFHGIKVVSQSDLHYNYIKLEDITRNFNKPCVLDIKVGQTMKLANETETERERVKQKYPEQELFGFRIAGMKVYKKDLKTFKVFDKSYGKKLKTHQEVLQGFREFFCPGDHGHKYISEMLKELVVIESWFCEQRRFRLFSSSILIVYEGEPKTIQNDFKECNCVQKMTKHSTSESLDNIHYCGNYLETCRNCSHRLNYVTNCQEVPQVTVRLVDFAHTYIGEYTEADTNYLYGLRSLIQYFKELLT